MHKLLESQAINLDSCLEGSNPENLTEDFKALLMDAFAKSEKRLWLTHDSKGCRTDFGTVFIVPDEIPDVFVADILDQEEGGTTFVAPAAWRMPHLLKALGAFESVSQAMKNGWNKDIPAGFSQHTVRIAKTKGCITIFKLPLPGFKVEGEEWVLEDVALEP